MERQQPWDDPSWTAAARPGVDVVGQPEDEAALPAQRAPGEAQDSAARSSSTEVTGRSQTIPRHT